VYSLEIQYDVLVDILELKKPEQDFNQSDCCWISVICNHICDGMGFRCE